MILINQNPDFCEAEIFCVYPFSLCYPCSIIFLLKLFLFKIESKNVECVVDEAVAEALPYSSEDVF